MVGEVRGEVRMSDTQGIAGAGTLIGDRYRIEALIGRGGMASVYRARDEVLGRVVALKIVAPASADASAVRRQRAEIELLASLNHHALVTLFDAGVDEVGGAERTYLVMELVDGPTLGARIEQGPIDPIDVCRMAVDLAAALHVVHAKGVVHRDIKPGNVLLQSSALPDHEFTAKLADFGIAYLMDSTRLTVAGGLVGTAGYLSPEQARGDVPAPMSDVYSLGLVLLEALTRTRAFPGSLVESISARLVSDPPIPVALGRGWTSLLSAMTARSPAQRLSALDVAAAARRIELDLGAPGERAGAAATAASEPVAEAPTTVALSAGAAGSTRVMSAVAVDELDRDVLARADDREHSIAPHRLGRWWSRRRIALAVVALLLLSAAVLIGDHVLVGPTHEVPALPATVKPLGTDLQTLMDRVTP